MVILSWFAQAYLSTEISLQTKLKSQQFHQASFVHTATTPWQMHLHVEVNYLPVEEGTTGWSAVRFEPEIELLTVDVF